MRIKPIMIALSLLCAALLWSGSYGQADNSTCLQFQELPTSPSAANQERTILENGLQGWASVPHAFIDATGERGLPIGLLRNTVPPLVHNGTSLSADQLAPLAQQLFQQFGSWWAPMLTVTLLGIAFAIAFAITGLVFCCCRCCGNCGGSRLQNKSGHEGIIKICLGIVLAVLVILILIGAIIALVGNEQVNRNVNNFNQELSSVIGDLREYVNTSVFELDFVFDQSSVALNCSVDFLRSSLNAAAMRAGQRAQENFTTVLDSAVSTSQSLSTALSTLNEALLSLQTLQFQVAALEKSLGILSDNLTSLAMECNRTLGNASQTCSDIAEVSDQVQLSQGIDIGAQLSNLTGLQGSLLAVQDELDAAIMQMNVTFNNYTSIVDQLNSAVDEVVQNLQNVTMEYQTEVEMLIYSGIQDILKAFDLAPPGQAPPDGAITAAQRALDSATGFVQDNQRIVYGFVILLCCFVLIVVAVLVGALVCAILSHRRDALPWNRSKLSHCTAITLLIGVGLMFLFAFLLLILCATVFFLAAMGQKVCYSAGAESNYAIFSEFTDEPIWNGNQTLFEFLSQGRLNVTASGIILSCSNDAALFQVFNVQSVLSSTGGFSFDILTNLSELIPSTRDLLAQLPTSVNFSPDNVIAPETTRLLDGLQTDFNQFNLTDSINSLNQSLTDFTVEGLLNNLTQWRTALPSADSLISGLEEFVNTTVRNETEAANMTKEQVVMNLSQLQAEAMMVTESADNTASAVNSLVAELNSINITAILVPEIESTRAVLVRFADNYTDYALDTVMNEVGRCQPIFDSYSDVYVQVCESTLVGLNAFWWSLGWCVLLFIPAIVVSIILARYYARMRGPKSEGPYDGSRTASFKLDKYYSN